MLGKNPSSFVVSQRGIPSRLEELMMEITKKHGEKWCDPGRE
jgi:hypothetical protein